LKGVNGDIKLVTGNQIQTALNEYEEKALVWTMREKRLAELGGGDLPIETFKENDFWFIAYVKNNYYVLSKDTLNWKNSDRSVFDGYMSYDKDVAYNGREHQDVLHFQVWSFPDQVDDWEFQGVGMIFGEGVIEDEEKLKFISYSSPSEYELPSDIKTSSHEVETSLVEGKPWTLNALHVNGNTGYCPGLTCRGFLAERNIKTGEIRIRYSEILSIRGEDIK